MKRIVNINGKKIIVTLDEETLDIEAEFKEEKKNVKLQNYFRREIKQRT